MGRIQALSASVINKIAAGEVIERPASVVKELVENSIDAGARRIDVTVEKGGTELIRVVDDGHGISPEDLPLAVASHATSKISDADDLFRVGTLGFRGEALASIAEVSRLVIRSRQPGAEQGWQLEVDGGRRTEPGPCGCPVGTVLEISNLFFNTPVRRKFMRTTQTELGHIGEAITRLALAHPHITFNLRHNERIVAEYPATEDLTARIAKACGPEIAENLIAVESSDDEVQLHGYVAHPSQSRGNQRMQYLFLNGRHIRDRSLQHALQEAYRGLLLHGRYPIAFLYLQMPPAAVDVNVHPTKLEVRFQDGGRIYSHLLSTVRTRFLTSDLDTRIRTKPQSEAEEALDPGSAQRIRDEFVGWARGEAGRFDQPQSADQGAAAGPTFARRPLALNKIENRWRGSGPSEPPPRSHAGFVPAVENNDSAAASPPAAAWITSPPTEAAAGASSGETAAPLSRPSGTPQAIQVHNSYLIVECDEGITVIDQHALHERIMYEHLRERVLGGNNLQTQRLLVPEPVDLPPEEAAGLLEHQELLRQFGLLVEPFGGDTLLVVGVPAVLRKGTPTELLRVVAERLSAGGQQPQARDLVDDLLNTMACKAAVKAGDPLTAEEISALLEQRHLVHDTHHCPHGRPTALVLTRAELDKQFKRT